jgi:hypothetical protein
MLLADLVISSNLTSAWEAVPQLSCLPTILERVSDESHLPLDGISTTIKSPAILHHSITKRDIMEDIVASYSTVFGTKSQPGKCVLVFCRPELHDEFNSIYFFL